MALTATQNIQESIPTHSVIFDADKSRGFNVNLKNNTSGLLARNTTVNKISVFSDKQIKETLCAAIYAEQPTLQCNSVVLLTSEKS